MGNEKPGVVPGVMVTFKVNGSTPTKSEIYIFNAFTVLTFANSMLNPLLYAFLSDNFRKSFAKAFKCATSAEINKSLVNENSIFTKANGRKRSSRNNHHKSERYELTTMTVAENAGLMKTESVASVHEEANLYVDKESQT